MENNNEFKNRCYGLIIIKSENSNFNADFTGNPRRLPDDNGTIYATDKALKYCIRRYWVDYGEDVFVWRSHLDNGNFRTRDERMEYMRNVLSSKVSEIKKLLEIEQWMKEKRKDKGYDISDDDMSRFGFNEHVKKLKSEIDEYKNDKDKQKAYDEKMQEIRKDITAAVFSKCIDTKLMGVTYTGEGPLSLTGPLQISYGINRYNNNTIYVNDILSPYPSGDESAVQSSIGKEIKALLSFYVYDFALNPKNIVTHYETNSDIKELMTITEKDIESLKDAMKHSVTYLNSNSKMGSENALLLFVTLNEDSKICLPTLKSLIEVKDDVNNPSKKIIEMEKVMDELFTIIKDIKQIELYYNKNICDVALGSYNFDNKIITHNTL